MSKNISKLKTVKNFGFIDNYSWPHANELEPFNQYNLIYGFNGSGKTSLSRLLAVLEKGALPADTDYSSAEFSIELTTKPVQTVTQASSINYPAVRVFNRDFIDDHIQLKDGRASAIYHLVKLDPQDQKKLDELEDRKRSIVERQDQAKNKLRSEQDRREKLLTNTAKLIKASIAGHSLYYLNYKAPRLLYRLTPLISGNEQPSQLSQSQLKTAQVDAVARVADDKLVTLQQPLFSNLVDKVELTQEILGRKILSEAISRYEAKPDINKWAEHGYALHKTHKSATCLYCDSPISSDRQLKLDKHFNNEYSRLKSDLKGITQDIDSGLRLTLKLPDEKQFNASLRDEASLAIKSLSEQLQDWGKLIDRWLILLEKKSSEPNVPIKFDLAPAQISKMLKVSVKKFNEIVARHNDGVDKFESKKDSAAKRIELHYASECLPGIQKIDEKVNALESEIKNIEKEYKTVEAGILELRSKATGDGAAAKEIDRVITTLLNRSDIKLVPTGGPDFEIHRAKQKARYLSEGEQTAVAFAYFCSDLLKDGESSVRDVILVIDDPISSLDHHRLFAIAAQVKALSSKVSQTLLLTHNYDYFRELRKWLTKKNSDMDQQGKQPVANLYYVESVYDNEGVRKMSLGSLPELLKKYDSDYHFNFEQLYIFAKQPDAGLAYYMPNITRKVLETFLAFKAPGSEGLSSLGQFCDEVTRDKINRFLNFTNHADYIDKITKLDHGVISGAQDAVSDVLGVIEDADRPHYDALVKKCREV